MAGNPSEQQPSNGFGYRRLEAWLLSFLPNFITPLRIRIFLGYIVVGLLGFYGWDQIAAAWRYTATLLAPVAALVGAVFALKISAVLVSLLALLTSAIKLFFGFLVIVLKPGILKAIFIPQIISILTWIHRKSYRLQLWFDRYYKRAKKSIERIAYWWARQNSMDKILISGFVVPLLLVVIVVFIIQRALAVFAVKKLTEQLVQKTTKFTMKNFHKLPLVGSMPSAIVNRTKKLTRKDDRTDLITDLKHLGDEIFVPEQTSIWNKDEE